MNLAASLPPLSPLVGRDRELVVLRDRLAAALAGRGGLVLISGEAGIGKTALANAFAREATGAGARILVGHSYDRTETPPYGPWRECLAQLREGDNRGAAPLVEPPSLTAVSHQDAFFAQVRAFAVALAAKDPQVLVLEDLHWADTASLDLLRYLARTLVSVRLLLVVTYRSDELHRHHPLAAMIPLLIREVGAERLDLRPLNGAAIEALVRTRYALPDGDVTLLSAYLIERTGGNALFLTELLRTLEEDLLLRREGSAWRVGAIADAPVPRFLKQVIDTRLTRLGDSEDALLAVAAVIGQEVPFSVWEVVTKASEDTLVTLIERAEAVHLVSAWANGEGFRFAHAMIREVLYEGVSAIRRRRLHCRIGEVLAALPASDPDAVAYHFQEAGDERAAAWLVRAAERAEDAYALMTAADRYEAAFTLLDIQNGDAVERCWLRLLAASLRNYQRPEHALVWVEEAVRLAEHAGDASLTARTRAMHGLLLCYLGEFATGLKNLAVAVEEVEQLPQALTAAARRREEQIDRIANSGTLTAFLAYLGYLAESRTRGERYLAALSAPALNAAQIGTIADVHTGLSMAYALQGEPTLARASYAAAISAYESINHYMLMLMKQREELLLAVLPYQADDLAERGRVTAAAERTALRLIATGARDDTDLPDYSRIPLLVLEGHWREAREILERPDTANITRNSHFRNSYLGPLARAQGDAGRAWRCVREVWPDGPATEPGKHFVDFTLPLQLTAAALALDEGDLATARAWLDAHRRWLDFAGATLGRSEEESLEAAWHRAAGDASGARTHAERALAHATTPRQPLALFTAHRRLGELATDAGQAAQAEAHLITALALADACRAPYERALALLARAELAAATGDMAAATETLNEARTIGEPLDARLILARANALATRLDAHTPTRATSSGGLSAREIEVLRLVAAGLSNRDIAERLSLSRRTVDHHLSSVYDKLGIRSRATAVRFALEHGLR